MSQKIWDRVKKDLNKIREKKFISLGDAYRWMKGGAKKQVESREKKFLSTFRTKYVFFTRGIHFVRRKCILYLTYEGFILWCIKQHCKKADVVRALVASANRESPIDSHGSPPGSSSRSRNLDHTPMKLVFPKPSETDPDLQKIAKEYEAEEKTHSQVYFLTFEPKNYWKVGLTTRPIDQRIAQLQTGTPFKLLLYKSIQTDNPAMTEKSIHSKLQNFKCDMGGGTEWFEMSEGQVDEFIKSLKK